MTEEKPHVLWEHDGFRLVRHGDEAEALAEFESALWSMALSG